MEIPYQQIPSDLLVSLIESFVMREGTDYGHADYSMQQKVEQVIRQFAVSIMPNAWFSLSPSTA